MEADAFQDSAGSDENLSLALDQLDANLIIGGLLLSGIREDLILWWPSSLLDRIAIVAARAWVERADQHKVFTTDPVRSRFRPCLSWSRRRNTGQLGRS